MVGVQVRNGWGWWLGVWCSLAGSKGIVSALVSRPRGHAPEPHPYWIGAFLRFLFYLIAFNALGWALCWWGDGGGFFGLARENP